MALKGSANKMVRSSNYIGSIPRTAFPRKFDFRTTFSGGYLFPIYADEVYPGSQKKIDVGALVRSITPAGPVMDKSFLDIFFFFVPSRLLWDHFEEFIAGYNKEAWTQGVEYSKPKILFKATALGGSETDNRYLHSFLDYLPGACDVVSLSHMQNLISTYEDADEKAEALGNLNHELWIDALYPRAFVKTWNDWFRDENLQDEYELYTGDNDEYADEFCFDLLDPTKLPKAAKYHNRITSALPAPVKGPDVLIPMTNLAISGEAPLKATLFSNLSAGNNFDVVAWNTSEEASKNADVVPYSPGPATIKGKTYADVSGLVANNVSNTIRMLRIATQTEKLLARDARGGTRFCESILSHFAVHNGDARLQRSEYLGSFQIPLQVQQVTNTAESAAGALGNVGGQSVTKFNKHIVNAAFSEWGIVLGLAVVRTNISYSSGVRKIYQRGTRFEHIWPEFRHVGDVKLLTREVDVNEELILTDYVPDRVFGYTPYASEKREGYNYNNGLFRHRATGSLAYLTYQEKYPSDDFPQLSAEFIEQPTDIISDTLVVQSGPQYYALFEISEVAIEPLDPTSDPGLMDHF